MIRGLRGFTRMALQQRRASGKEAAREHVSLSDRYVRFYNRAAETGACFPRC